MTTQGEAMTALASAMKRAGVKTDIAWLYTLTQREAEKANLNNKATEYSVQKRIANDEWLLRVLLQNFVGGVIDDMTGASGQKNDCALPVADMNDQENPSRAQSPHSGGGLQTDSDTSDTNPASARPSSDAEMASGSIHDRGPRRPHDDHDEHSASVVKPKLPKQGKQIDPAIRIASRLETTKSIYDTIKLSDGRSIGDVTWGELLRLAKTRLYDGFLAVEITKHARNVTLDSVVRDVVPKGTLARAEENAIKERSKYVDN